MNLVQVIVGLQWGDEGKGKVVDLFAQTADIVVRSSGGANAGHSLVVDDQEIGLHLIPSGILNPKVHCHIAPGVVLDPEALIQEMEFLARLGVDFQGRFTISPNAPLVMHYHKVIDQCLERKKGSSAVGTTGKGIGPTFADKVLRVGLILSDLADPLVLQEKLHQIIQIKQPELESLGADEELLLDPLYIRLTEWYEKIKAFIYPLERDWDELISQGKKILLEGAQGTLLDITFGSYPFVTSSQTIAAGILAGAGMSPFHVDEVVGVVKAYQTRVGGGPFPTELEDPELSLFPDAKTMREYGVTTGRKRRIGWFDAPLTRYAVRLNGANSLVLTKLDILDQLDHIKICVGYKLRGEPIEKIPLFAHELSQVEPIFETFAGWKKSTRGLTKYEDLPRLAKVYIERIQELSAIPIHYISTGPDRKEIICLKT